MILGPDSKPLAAEELEPPRPVEIVRSEQDASFQAWLNHRREAIQNREEW